MTKLKSVLFAGAAACLALTGCQSTKPMTVDDQIASLYALPGKSVKGAKLSDADALKAMLEGLGTGYTVSFGEVMPEANGSVAKQVVFSLKDNPKVKLSVDELRAWDANADLGAMMAANEDARLAKRLIARGVSFSGLETVLDGVMDSYMDSVEQLATAAAGDEAAAELDKIDQSFGAYAVTIDELLIDDLVIHALSDDALAFMSTASQSDDDDEEGFKSALAMFGRWNLALSAPAIYASNTGFVMDVSQAVEGELKQDMSMSGTIDKIGYAGLDRGDVDFVVMDGFTFTTDMKMGPDGDAPLPSLMNIEGTYDRYLIEDVSLATLADFLARGETPDMSVENLMSLGKWTALGGTASLNGQPYYTAAKTEIDLTQWRWFFPEKISFSVEDGSFGLSAFMDYMQSIMELGASLELQENDATMEDLAEMDMVLKFFGDAKQVFEDVGLSTIGLSYSMDLNWDSDNGAITMDWGGDLEELGAEQGDLALSFPSFGQLKGLAPAEGEELDGDALGELFLSETALRDFNLSIDDNGGIAKLFELVHGFANIIPEDELDPQMAMVRNTPPEQMRATAQGMMRMGSMVLNDQFPPAVSWINAMADWVQNGGVLSINVNPPEPIGADLLESLEDDIGDDPTSLVDILGVEISHTPDETE